jgi:hypothetical protein
MRQQLRSACTHTDARTAGPLVIDPGALTPAPPSPMIASFSRAVDDPGGSAEEFEKVFWKA